MPESTILVLTNSREPSAGYNQPIVNAGALYQ
jgi:hypothetical protein